MPTGRRHGLAEQARDISLRIQRAKPVATRSAALVLFSSGRPSAWTAVGASAGSTFEEGGVGGLLDGAGQVEPVAVPGSTAGPGDAAHRAPGVDWCKDGQKTKSIEVVSRALMLRRGCNH